MLLLAVCAVALVAAGCGGDDEKTPEDVPADAIALLGDTPVPRTDFDTILQRAEESYKQQKRPFPKPGTPEYQDLKTRAVQFLVQKYEFRAEAEELGVKVTDEDVTKRLDEIKQQAFQGDEKKFQAALKRENLTEAEARSEIRDRILQEKLYEKVTKNVKVSDADVEAYYEKNKEQFTQPEGREVRHIVVKSKAKADEVYRELQGGADFAKLARAESTDAQTRKAGGKLEVTKGSTLPAFDKAAFGLETGQFSKPVKTSFGWHVIQAVSDVRPAKATPLKDVKATLEQRLLQEKRNAELEKWLKNVKEKYAAETVYAAGFQPPKTETGTTGATTTTSE
ncbi:MAG: peptidyl-prolyl cis-trans isomerase [Thermoleophilia bacterium]|nr:peptidyl-prolyl cis-trans isomerase [Thermoleophilia bacterium]